jgi:hypothetical protein
MTAYKENASGTPVESIMWIFNLQDRPNGRWAIHSIKDAFVGDGWHDHLKKV